MAVPQDRREIWSIFSSGLNLGILHSTLLQMDLSCEGQSPKHAWFKTIHNSCCVMVSRKSSMQGMKHNPKRGSNDRSFLQKPQIHTSCNELRSKKSSYGTAKGVTWLCNAKCHTCCNLQEWRESSHATAKARTQQGSMPQACLPSEPKSLYICSELVWLHTLCTQHVGASHSVRVANPSTRLSWRAQLKLTVLIFLCIED